MPIQLRMTLLMMLSLALTLFLTGCESDPVPTSTTATKPAEPASSHTVTFKASYTPRPLWHR